MFLDSSDYQSVWKLALNWDTPHEPPLSSESLPPQTKEHIYRLMYATVNQQLSIRNKHRAFFLDDSILSTIIDFPHLVKYVKCQRRGIIDKDYLDSIYVRRSEVLRWCQQEFITPPAIWRLIPDEELLVEENAGWYEKLTDKHKRVITCLGIAKRLWKENDQLQYEEVYEHPDMLKFDKPRAFTLNRSQNTRHFSA